MKLAGASPEQVPSAGLSGGIHESAFRLPIPMPEEPPSPKRVGRASVFRRHLLPMEKRIGPRMSRAPASPSLLHCTALHVPLIG